MTDDAQAVADAQVLRLLGEVRDAQADNTTRLDHLQADLDAVRVQRGSTEESDVRLTKVERAVKWASPWKALIAMIAITVVTAVTVVTATRDYAKEVVIKTAKEAHAGPHPQIEPSVATVNQLKGEVASVKGGVDCLVGEQERQRKIKELELRLVPFVEDYEQRLQEFSARRAAGRRVGKKPTKKEGHLALESELSARATRSNEDCKKKPEERKP